MSGKEFSPNPDAPHQFGLFTIKPDNESLIGRAANMVYTHINSKNRYKVIIKAQDGEEIRKATGVVEPGETAAGLFLNEKLKSQVP